jgi:signal transduction histidine kinase
MDRGGAGRRWDVTDLRTGKPTWEELDLYYRDALRIIGEQGKRLDEQAQRIADLEREKAGLREALQPLATGRALNRREWEAAIMAARKALEAP